MRVYEAAIVGKIRPSIKIDLPLQSEARMGNFIPPIVERAIQHSKDEERVRATRCQAAVTTSV